ncbi:hypothetical protein GCM10027055_11750 [Janibacter alkaliphilus]|uniref:non-specific serine/threonine protein kinase n=1 Tax=Janibacter alkaliphilus TaxID=1069963 RepID=A0A852X392_9MICO|nr:serine/threonine-protein kinase [Janibacter alkaliphilus]NYG37832.1 serine/threonine protein kinase [Janibacter alkaliphilus]
MAPAAPAAPHVPGYRLTRLLGAGGSSRVWRGRRESDESLVAIKVVDSVADDATIHEWSLLQHVASEHVVTLHEVLDIDTEDGPALALVLDLLAGGSLGTAVAQRGHLSPGECVTVLSPVATALDRLHELGIVHGDVSPGNVLLDSTGRPVLADLGVARLTGVSTGDVHGTDGFVAPEVLLGDEPGRASDIYALGAIAWLCLTGDPPGHVAGRGELADGAPEAPAPLVELVEECLAPDPDDRPDAQDAAVRFFDAAPAQALRLTSPGDVATGLTRRIREAAQEDPTEADLPWQRSTVLEPIGWRERRRHRRDERRDRRARRREAATALTASGRHRAEGRGTGRWFATLVAAAVAGIALAVAGPALSGGADSDEGRRLADQSASRADQAGPTTPSASTTSSSASTAGTSTSSPDETRTTPTSSAGGSQSGSAAELLGSRSAPRTDPVAVVRALGEVRADLLAAGEPDGVPRLDVPGSPAADADREHLTAMQQRGETYRGVELTVRRASTRSSSDGIAVVRATVDEGAYAVRSADGDLEQRPARSGEPVDLVLRWHEGRWRISEVRAT